MSDPKIAVKQPALVKLEAGRTYALVPMRPVAGPAPVRRFAQEHRVPPVGVAGSGSGRGLAVPVQTHQESPYCDGTHKTL